MSILRLAAVPLCLLALPQLAWSQCCEPLSQSFLSEISVRWEDDTIRVRLEYSKAGGSPKDAYQAYLIAYLDRDVGRVPTPAGEDVLDPRVTLVLHTQIMQRCRPGERERPWTYALEFAIHKAELVGKVIEHMKLGEEDREDGLGWHDYRDLIRFAVFVPWPDDDKYSVLDGLPGDRHECNGPGERALLFQTLPYRLRFLVGESGGPADGLTWVTINGDRPPIDKDPPTEEKPAPEVDPASEEGGATGDRAGGEAEPSAEGGARGSN